MDPMAGSGGRRGHTPSSVEEDNNSNSNVISLLEVCFLCNRRFLYESNSCSNNSKGQKEEGLILKLFFEDIGSLGKSLQCCTFCKTLCNSLMDSKAALSKTIDEIGDMMRKSKKLASASSHTLSKSRVIMRLFQEPPDTLQNPCPLAHFGNLSQMPIQLEEFQENSSGFSNNFTQLKLNGSQIPSTATNISSQTNETMSENSSLAESPNLSFLMPSSQNREQSSEDSSPEKSNNNKRSWKSALYSPVASYSAYINGAFIPATEEKTVMVSNSSGRFVLMRDSVVNFEENARDVGDVPLQIVDNNSSGFTLSGISGQKDYIKAANEQPIKNNFSSSRLNLESELEEKSETETETDYTDVDNNETESPLIKSNKGNHICNFCSKRFKNNRDLALHIGFHKQERKYVCEICGESYRHKKALLIHIEIHQGKAPYECDHCGKIFTQKIGLRRHLPMHTGQFAHQCDLCGKGFYHLSSFTHHKISHSGEKNFQCQICQNFFVSKPHLNRHLRNLHRQEKPYICSTCNKAFSEKSHYNAHQKVHTKKELYQCSHDEFRKF